MGILSSLGNIMKFVPVPGVSQAGNLLSMVGDVSSVLGGQQAGKNNAAAAQANLQGQHDRNAIDLFQAQQQGQNQAGQLDLQRKNFEQGSRGTDAKQALIGALLGGGVTPTSIAGGHASGGLLRSLNANPEALAAMKTMGSQGSAAQSTPLAFTGGQMLTGPQLSAMPKIDAGGGFLGTLTKLGQLAGAAGKHMGQGSQAVVPDIASVVGLDPRFLPGQSVAMDIPNLKKPQQPADVFGGQY